MCKNAIVDELQRQPLRKIRGLIWETWQGFTISVFLLESPGKPPAMKKGNWITFHTQPLHWLNYMLDLFSIEIACSLFDGSVKWKQLSNSYSLRVLMYNIVEFLTMFNYSSYKKIMHLSFILYSSYKKNYVLIIYFTLTWFIIKCLQAWHNIFIFVKKN